MHKIRLDDGDDSDFGQDCGMTKWKKDETSDSLPDVLSDPVHPSQPTPSSNCPSTSICSDGSPLMKEFKGKTSNV